jgi:hypothetical protein
MSNPIVADRKRVWSKVVGKRDRLLAKPTPDYHSQTKGKSQI